MMCPPFRILAPMNTSGNSCSTRTAPSTSALVGSSSVAVLCDQTYRAQVYQSEDPDLRRRGYEFDEPRGAIRSGAARVQHRSRPALRADIVGPDAEVCGPVIDMHVQVDQAGRDNQPTHVERIGVFRIDVIGDLGHRPACNRNVLDRVQTRRRVHHPTAF